MFTHLHVHSVYSLLDGFNKIPDMIRRTKEIEQTAIALTDHNHLAGIPEFLAECDKQDIKPLPGLEGYFTPSITEMMKPVEQRNKEGEEQAIKSGNYTQEQISKMKREELKKVHAKYNYCMDNYHILFIAKDQQGWNNLVKLQSEAARLCTFNGRYHVDYELLRKYHEGLICTTACIGAYPAEMISANKEDSAREYLQIMQDIFGGDFYLEIQPLSIKKQHLTNLFYMQYGKENGIKTVATNDSHWTLKEDSVDHDVLLCIGTGKKVIEPDRMHYYPEFWLRSEEEMVEAFEKQVNDMADKVDGFEDILDSTYVNYYKEALQNTQEIVDKVENNIKLGSSKPLFTAVKIPEDTTPEKVLTRMACKGLAEYLKEHKECDVLRYASQLFYELDVINSKGFAPYFLTVEEYITWANKNGCPTGPGRGSAAGSLVLFCIGVTKNIDPIKNHLLFSRFLTADRTSPPDIDMDLSWLNRDKVVRHLEEYYGKEKVAHIGTFGTMKVKSGIKDVCRVLSIPFVDSLKISKEIDAIDTDPNLSFSMIDKWEQGDEQEIVKWQKFHELEVKNAEVFRLARRFEGIPRQLGVHASGYLVTPCAITDVTPVRYDKDGAAITLYPGPILEEENLIKYDLLGLKTLDQIQLTLKSIDSSLTMEDLYEKADIHNADVYDMICAKQTDAIFQIESDMMKGLIEKIQPNRFEDLSALVAIG